MTTEQWTTIKDTCAYLRIHKMTLHRWISEGRIPAYRLAGSKELRLKTTDVEALLVPASD